MGKIFALAKSLFTLEQEGVISLDALKRGLEMIKYKPSSKAWRFFIDKLILVLGISLLSSGAIFFFAYNWKIMNKFLKFGAIEIVLVLGIVLAVKRGINTYTGKLSLLFSSILVGVLLAVVGQVYQSGADSYLLFLVWSILIVAWIVVSEFLSGWTLLLILSNLSIFLYYKDSLWIYSDNIYYSIIIFNTIGLCLFEFFYVKGIDYLKQRWFPRLILIIITVTLSLMMMSIIFDDISSQWGMVFYLFLVTGGLLFYIRRRDDLFAVMSLFLSIIYVVDSLIVKILFDGGNQDVIGSFLFFSSVLIIEGGVLVYLLKWVKKIYSFRKEEDK